MNSEEQVLPTPESIGRREETLGESELTPEEGSRTAADRASAEPDYDQAVRFLRRWRADGPWLVTSIYPPQSKAEKKHLRSREFVATEVAELRAWLESEGATRNLYWSLNPLLRVPESGKASKADVAAVVALHVDLDPRPGEDLGAERERILRRLTTERPAEVHEPTCIVDSGGGYQAYWKLRDPIVLDGDLEKAAEAERYTRWLEATLLFADDTHNVDRLLRLPGTVNRPELRKRERGRGDAHARVVEPWHEDDAHVYELDAFQQALPRGQVQGAASGLDVVPSEVRQLASVDDLPATVSELCKVVIVQGHDPDNPTKFGSSRSEVLFFACCELVRAGCSEEQIYAVITDPKFRVSASVLDKGRHVHSYALRQIRRAREEAIAPELRELNDKHAVVESHGGKTRILSWERGNNREMLHLQSFGDFEHRYCNRQVLWTNARGQQVSSPLGKWWVHQPARRQYRGIVFDPSQGEEVDGHLNLWRGFSVEPMPGDWSLLGRHIEEVLACGDSVAAEYILRWAAWAVQNPEHPAEVALVFRGGQGTGKGTFARWLGRLFGQHFVHVASGSEVTGKHNAHLRDCVLLFADEACTADNKEAIGKLKALITEPTLMVEPKFVDASQWPNRLHVVVASNESSIVRADADDRRFVVLDISTHRREEEAWFRALNEQMEAGGLAAMLFDLQHLDLRGWHPRQGRPQTAALTEQKIDSLRGVERAWFECLQTGELPQGEHASEAGAVLLPSQVFLEHAVERTGERKLSSNQLAKLLGRPQRNDRTSLPGMEFANDQRDRNSRRCWLVPPLAEARALWDERRFPVLWDTKAPWDSTEGWLFPGEGVGGFGHQ